MDNFNQLTTAQTERLAILAEEMGEALQIIGKILRHGLYSYDPVEGNEYKHNSFLLSIEMGDVLAAMDMLVQARDIDDTGIELRRQVRPKKIAKYLHHQPSRDRVSEGRDMIEANQDIPDVVRFNLDAGEYCPAVVIGRHQGSKADLIVVLSAYQAIRYGVNGWWNPDYLRGNLNLPPERLCDMGDKPGQWQHFRKGTRDE